MKNLTSAFKIRQAEPEESLKLTEISIQAKSHWGYPEKWINKYYNAPGELIVTPEIIKNIVS